MWTALTEPCRVHPARSSEPETAARRSLRPRPDFALKPALCDVRPTLTCKVSLNVSFVQHALGRACGMASRDADLVYLFAANT